MPLANADCWPEIWPVIKPLIDSVMAGLACGETSPLAWRFLEPLIDHFMTIGDGDAVGAMQLAAAGSDEDVPLLVGESGAAGLAGLIRTQEDSPLARAVGLAATSRALLINTEGATAPLAYAQLVGESAESVLARQAGWITSRLRASPVHGSNLTRGRT